MLRAGADPHALPTPTPAERAEAVDGEVSRLVLRAARPWNPDGDQRNHDLYPDAARARAIDLLRLGKQLSREPQRPPLHLWVSHVMPHAVRRGGAQLLHMRTRLSSLEKVELVSLLAEICCASDAAQARADAALAQQDIVHL